MLALKLLPNCSLSMWFNIHDNCNSHFLLLVIRMCVCVFVTVAPFLWFIFITLLPLVPHTTCTIEVVELTATIMYTLIHTAFATQFATIATNIRHLTRFTHAFCMHFRPLFRPFANEFMYKKDSQCIYRIKYCGFRVEKAIKASSSDGKRNIFEDAIPDFQNVTTRCGQ